MTREDIYNLPKCAGIYCIKNTINGKCYIGQAIKLQKRLKAHWSAITNPRYAHIVLYKAINKYGIDKFELKVVEIIRDSLDWRTKGKLDQLEKKYIQEYDSYNNGYNSTLGGDAGVLGLKQSEETKQHLREIKLAQLKEEEKDQTKWVKAFNIKTKEEVIAPRTSELSKLIEVSPNVISKCINKHQLFGSKVWIFSRYLEDYPKYPEFESDEYLEVIDIQFKTLSNKADILEYIKENPKTTYGQISQEFSLSKKTFYNYRNELGIKI